MQREKTMKQNIEQNNTALLSQSFFNNETRFWKFKRES